MFEKNWARTTAEMILENQTHAAGAARTFVSDLQNILNKLDDFKNELPAFELASIYVDQAMNVIKKEIE